MAAGLAMTGVGGIGLGLGLLRAAVVPATLLGVSGHALVSGLGFSVLVSGILLTLFSLRRAPEAPPIVPAHVAFVTKTPRPVAIPERPPAPAAPRALPAHKPQEDPAMTRLDDEIRDLTRQINKAGILLATGQISRQGYASYVEDLKKKRGDLEASRVRLELHRVG